MRSILLLVVLSSCTHTIAEQKPRAWFADFDTLPEAEPLPTGMATPRPTVFAVGARIPIESSWSAVCKRPVDSGGNNGQTQWEIEDCKAVPHQAVLICDNPACRVDPPAKDVWRQTGVATLTAPGRYPLRVQFVYGIDGERKEVKLPVIEAVYPDDAAVRCTSDDSRLYVEVSLLHDNQVIAGSPSLALSSGAACKPLGSSYFSHAAAFECPLQSPGLAQWLDGKVVAPQLSRQFNASCERRVQ